MGTYNYQFEGQAIVCFIDILGFSDDIKKNWNNSKSNEHPLNKILSIREMIKTLEENARKAGEQYFQNEEDHIKIISMSDSFVIIISIEGIHDIQKIYRIWLFLKFISACWLSCISHGYTVRGAVSIGNVYCEAESIIGPVFIDVYKLESVMAKNSRVVMSSDMNQELKRLFDNRKNIPTDNQWVFDAISKFLRKDVDGYLIFNPKQFHKIDIDIISLLSNMKDKVNNNIVKEKYTPLINMLKNEDSLPLTVDDFGLY